MAKKKEQIPSPEWSVLVQEEDIIKKPIEMTISPDEQETKALVERLGLVSLDSLKVDVALRREPGGQVINVKGHIDAIVTQACVVTAEPVQNTLSEDFEGWYADPDSAVFLAKARREREMKHSHGESPILEEHEDPEAIIEGRIDVGELSTQYLSLALDPYPRSEIAEEVVEEQNKKMDTPIERANPFAALKDWKDKLTGQ